MKIKNAKCKMKNYDRGVSLLLTLLIMALILGISLGVSTILVQQTKMIRAMGESVIAFSAADTAIEKVAMNTENPSEFQECFSPPYNDICYQVKISSPGPNCQAATYCLRSIGSYKEVKRAVELKY
jgi:hypothetical protein